MKITKSFTSVRGHKRRCYRYLCLFLKCFQIVPDRIFNELFILKSKRRQQIAECLPQKAWKRDSNEDDGNQSNGNNY